MMLPLTQVTLDSLSDVRYSFRTGEHQGVTYPRTILAIRFEGVYRFGSGGNPDATFMVAMGNAAVEAFDPDAIILDLSGLSYEWGDQMECVFGIGHDVKRPTAVVVGDLCRQAIGTLCFGQNSSKDACEEEWIFDSMEEAWQYVTKQLDEGAAPPIHEAAKANDFNRVNELLDLGEDPNRQDSDGRTPLHVATDPRVVRLLIERGANVKATNSFGATPLHFATDVDCVALMLAAGADPNARTSHYSSPLCHAESVPIARLLIESGADVHLRNRTSLLHAVRNPDLAKLFIQSGVDVNSLDANGETPLDSAEWSAEIFRRQAERVGLPGDPEKAKAYAEIARLLRANGGKKSAELKTKS